MPARTERGASSGPSPVTSRIVNIDVPADGTGSRILQTTCMATATSALVDLDRLQDLRMAMTEILAELVARAARSTRLHATIGVQPTKVEIEVSVLAQTHLVVREPSLSGVSSLLMAAIANHHDLVVRDDQVVGHVTMSRLPPG